MAIAKKFQIDVIKDREVTERVYTAQKIAGSDKHSGFVSKETTRIVPESYMVYMPGGHSVWFETREQMMSAGILEKENVEIDLDTGMPVNPPASIDLKRRVESGTRTRAPR